MNLDSSGEGAEPSSDIFLVRDIYPRDAVKGIMIYA